MVPEKTKVEHKYIPPSWMDKKTIKTLSPDRQQYWANRILGRPGQGERVKLEGTVITESGVTISFNNAGEMVVHNRAARRNRPKSPNFYTKATHSIIKLRKKLNDEAKEQQRNERRKERSRARKASSQSNPSSV